MATEETEQVYGAGVCPRCEAAHAPECCLRESQRSRSKLMQLIAEVTAELRAAGVAPQPFAPVNPGPNGRFSIGILEAAQHVLVAASGNQQNFPALVAVVQRKGYRLCGPRGGRMGKHRTVQQVQIAAAEYEATEEPGGRIPGECVGPRLLEQAFDLVAPPRNISKWALSEVVFDATPVLSSDPGRWARGLPPHRCETCDRLMALLLCPQPAEEAPPPAE